MQDKPNDTLLRGSTILLWGFMAIFAIGSVLIMLGLGTFLVWQTGIFGPIPDSATGLNLANAPELPLAMLLALAATILALVFTRLLLKIINSIQDGTPFTIANAKRLQSMAWLALTYQAVAAGLFFLGITVARIHPLEALVSGDELSLSALMLSLTLFILARVFKHGAAMRDDLEGTV